MPSKVRDSDRDKSRESPKKESSKSEKKEHHKSVHRKRSSTRSRDRPSDRSSTSTYDSKRRSSLPSSLRSEDVTTNPTMNSSRTSLPYPSFSKAHSKEAIGVREEIRPDVAVLTPESTDINASKERLEKIATKKPSHTRMAPPSPPLTHEEKDEHKKEDHKKDLASKLAQADSGSNEKHGDEKIKVKIRHKTATSAPHINVDSDTGSDLPSPKPSRKPSPANSSKTLLREGLSTHQRSSSQPQRVPSVLSSSAGTNQTNPSSNATSVAPNQPSVQRPASIPPGVTWVPRPQSTQPVDVFVVPEENEDAYSSVSISQPPPPPPPPVMPVSIPRVDYLLRNGGLQLATPKNLLLAGKPATINQDLPGPAERNAAVSSVFAPYCALLDDFETVISKNGSLAVATGYRSVARRLLDRLEAVFARDISSEMCTCSMCSTEAEKADNRGVSWGEILELVSGRRDLPTWPPFAFVPSSAGLGISLEAHIPMQKLDIDVPEEYRDHYIRQSRKTKQSVDKWLARQTTGPTNVPDDVDDETLLFAILTHIDPQNRSTYANLLGITLSSLEAPLRAPTPQRGPTPMGQPISHSTQRPEALVTATGAIQRLYRLAETPRDPEIALFMLNNPGLHNALATLAAVSNDEWEILISGRFDGFLRSGAEDIPQPPATPQGFRTPSRNAPSRNAPSRNAPSRGPTPYNGTNSQISQGGPITYDEEMEIATLAEIERDIYQGMEALEDAFEMLHVKAENIRRAIRERSAGLTMAAQRRRGGYNDDIEIRMGTPANGMFGDRWDLETDDGLGDWDGVSEIAPDDSASNVAHSRRRRPKRRTERRTPAPVSEEEEESEGTASPRKR